MKPEGETLGILQRIYVLPLLGLFFLNHKKQTSRLWQEGKRKQVFTTCFVALCIKTNCQNPPPCCLFSSKALLCCLGNQHTRPVFMTGTPGIWSSRCYLSLLNTNQGIAHVQPTLCLYKALNYFFFPSWGFLEMPDTLCQVHPAAIKGEMLMSLWKLYFQMVQAKMLLEAGGPLCATGDIKEN